MARSIELRRHTDNDGDVLTADGIAAAVALGVSMHGGYTVVASSGAQRATQTAACALAGLAERVPGGVVVEPGLRSDVEDRWRAAYQEAGAGDLPALQAADPELVESDGAALADALRHILDHLAEGDRALAFGHSPTNEAAVYSLTGQMVAPLGKGEGVLITDTGDGYTVERLR
jgi:broad specificity phosphatase PhoE